MKSITQINLGFLTEMKSLSESDSGMLQASQLIASGGAGLVSRYRRQTEPPAREVTVFSSLHFILQRHQEFRDSAKLNANWLAGAITSGWTIP